MSADRRLPAFVAASLLLHAAVVLQWGFDSGRRPAQAPPVITARIEPPAVEPAPQVQPDPLLAVPSAAPAWVVPEPQPVPPTLPPANEPPRAGGEAPPQQPPPPRTEPSARAEPAAPPAPLTEADRPGAADLTWYTGRDLDILPRPLDPIEPQFPINAQLRGVSGKVTLAVSIDAAGRVVDVEVVRADPPGFFEASALAAFRAARYAPGIKDGRAVRARLQTVVVFELGGR